MSKLRFMKPKVSCDATFLQETTRLVTPLLPLPPEKPGETDWVGNFTIGIGAAAEETTGMERILPDHGCTILAHSRALSSLSSKPKRMCSPR